MPGMWQYRHAATAPAARVQLDPAARPGGVQIVRHYPGGTVRGDGQGTGAGGGGIRGEHHG